MGGSTNPNYWLCILVLHAINGPLIRAMREDLGFSSGDAALIASAQLVGHGLGLLCWGGWAVDRFDVRAVYVATMLALAALTVCYSLAASVPAVAGIAAAMEFVATPNHAAHVAVNSDKTQSV